MKHLFQFLMWIFIFSACKKDSTDEITNPHPNPFALVELLPENQGKFFHMSSDAKFAAVWSPMNDVINVYSFSTSTKWSVITQTNTQSNAFNNVQISSDGQHVITDRNPDPLKLYNSNAGTYERDLERVYNWTVVPNTSYILGFSDNLIIKEGVKLVDITTGLSVKTDTFYEINSPSIAGFRNNNDEYVLVDYPIDNNNPTSPTRTARITIKNINTHQCLARYIINEQFYINSHVLSHDGSLITFTKPGVSTNQHLIATYNPLTGDFASGGTIELSNIPGYGYLIAGPGQKDILIYDVQNQNILQAEISPYVMTSKNYAPSSGVTATFQMIGCNYGGNRVVASYVETSGVSHLLLWIPK